MNVRFFAGTKADYLSLPSPRNPLGLYFCADTRELFWADRLLTDGTRIVATEADLPSLEKAADGITYFVEETHNGYVLSADKTKWIQVIYAPETGSAVKAISFAGIEMEEAEGVFTIDRRCAREALGFIVPKGMEDEELELVTKEYVIDAIAAQIPVEDLAKKEDLDEVKTKLETDVLPIVPTIQETVIPTVQALAEKAATQDWVKEQITEVNQSIESIENTYVTNETLEQNYITQEEIANTYVTEQYVTKNYITQDAAEDKIATVVETHVNEVVSKEIETKVTEVIEQKVEAGEITVNADAINYGDFEDDIV